MMEESVEACEMIDDVIRGKVLAYEVANDEDGITVRPKLVPVEKLEMAEKPS
jgi:hypothetical protein